MRNILIFIISFLILSFGAAAAEEQSRIIEEQYKASGAQELENITEQLIDKQTNEIIQGFDFNSITKHIASGNMSMDTGNILLRIFRFFLKEIYFNMKIMIHIVILTIISGLLSNLQSAFGRAGVAEVAFFSCYVFLTAVLIKSFSYAMSIGGDVIDSMVIFMQSMLPTLMTLLVSTGNITSASIFEPAVLFSVQMIAGIIKSFLIPLLLCATSLSIISNISEKFHISRLVNFMKQIGKWSLGIILTGFIGVITVQGLAASVIDGVGAKTVKFAVGNFVPVVGGILSDAVDAVISCSLILKNAVGIAGLIVIILICKIPIIKIAALIAIYRLTAAIVEPVSDERIVKCISDLGNSITYLFSMVVSVAVLFLLSITIVIGAGNISAMFR